MKERIVISGRGLVTPIGVGLAANLESLRTGKSGIVHMPDWEEKNIEVQAAGLSDRELICERITPKNKRFMSPNTIFAVAAADEAVREAGFTEETLPRDRMALLNGCAGSSYETVYHNASQFMQTGRSRRVSPFAVPKLMPSSAVASMSLIFGIRGESYNISCACTSSALALITAARLLLAGEYDYVMAGGSEEVSWIQALGFNAMHALSTHYNDATASRPFDKTRDGFVLGEGAGIMILERESTCLARGIRPKAVLSGYAANSNAVDMVCPDERSSTGVMSQALERAGLAPEEIQYINTHGTSTPVGDPIEMDAIRNVFHASGSIALNSTKSMTGHMIGAAGAAEAIFTTLMMEHSFVSPTLNLNEPEESFAWADLVRGAARENYEIRHALSNSFGFGGSNASLVLSSWEER